MEVWYQLGSECQSIDVDDAYSSVTIQRVLQKEKKGIED